MRFVSARGASLCYLAILGTTRAVQYIDTVPGTDECACFSIVTLEVFQGGRIDKWWVMWRRYTQYKLTQSVF